VAGIQPGDVIIAVDGQRVDYTAQLQQVVGFKSPGETVKVEVARDKGVRKIYNVRLVPQMSPAQLAAAEPPSEVEAEPVEKSVDLKDRLGVTLEPVDAETAQQLNLGSSTRGLIVQTVDPYGPTEGLLNPPSQQTVDIVTAFDGKPVKTEADLRAAMRGVRSGDIVSLGVTVAAGGGQTQNRIVRVKVR
jgi:serine protease Do